MDAEAKFFFPCPSCTVRLKIKNKFRGESRECPGCGKAIVIPTVESANKSPSIDPDAARSLHVLAVNAATLVQEAIGRDRTAGMILNSIFVFLPLEHELGNAARSVDEQHLKDAWEICSKVRSTLSQYGMHHRDSWQQSFQSMQIYDDGSGGNGFGMSMQRRRWSIKVRQQVWSRYGQSCYYCGIRLENWRGTFMHLDHLIPLAESGKDEESNLVPTCPDCNLEKGRKVYPELKSTSAQG